MVSLAGGAGLSRGVGSPDYRALVGLTFIPPVPAVELVCPECPEPVACDECRPCEPTPECPAEVPCLTKIVCEHEGPEDIDGYRDDDGCADPDNDHDTILDVHDACPLEPEDRDGYQDEDGCPDPDNDGDGILDADDRCPMDPEDHDGFQDADGCPDPDNDNDRIVDLIDACPNEPEDRDLFEDDDGCPEAGEGRVSIKGQKLVIMDKIYFLSGSSKIDVTKSAPILDQVAQILIQNNWLKRIEIQGHTDDRGKDAYNMDLSQRRSAAVKAYLAQQGVAAIRLQANGYGETKPIESNDTRLGRAANRRVEFVILESTNPGMVKIEQGDSRQVLDDEKQLKPVPLPRFRMADCGRYSKAQLRLMRNEVFARRGRRFKGKDLQEHFGRQRWYRPRYGTEEFSTQTMMTAAERELVARMRACEQRK